MEGIQRNGTSGNMNVGEAFLLVFGGFLMNLSPSSMLLTPRNYEHGDLSPAMFFFSAIPQSHGKVEYSRSSPPVPPKPNSTPLSHVQRLPNTFALCYNSWKPSVLVRLPFSLTTKLQSPWSMKVGPLHVHATLRSNISLFKNGETKETSSYVIAPVLSTPVMT